MREERPTFYFWIEERNNLRSSIRWENIRLNDLSQMRQWIHAVGSRAFMHGIIGQSAAPKFVPRAHQRINYYAFINACTSARITSARATHLHKHIRTRSDRQDKLLISSASADKSRIPDTSSRTRRPIVVSTIFASRLFHIYRTCRRDIKRLFFPSHSWHVHPCVLSRLFSIEIFVALYAFSTPRCHGSVDRPKPGVWPVQGMLGMPRSAARSFHSLQVKRSRGSATKRGICSNVDLNVSFKDKNYLLREHASFFVNLCIVLIHFKLSVIEKRTREIF